MPRPREPSRWTIILSVVRFWAAPAARPPRAWLLSQSSRRRARPKKASYLSDTRFADLPLTQATKGALTKMGFE